MSIGSIVRRVLGGLSGRRTRVRRRRSSPKAQLAKGAVRTASKHLK